MNLPKRGLLVAMLAAFTLSACHWHGHVPPGQVKKHVTPGHVMKSDNKYE